MSYLILIVLLLLSATPTHSLELAGDIQLYPNTQNSPSIYILPFTILKALPSNSYILVTMDWYSSTLLPYNCVLVNTSIPVSCVNLATLTAVAAQVTRFNSKLITAKTVAVSVGSNLLAGTIYSLQLHFYNVVPNIQSNSPNIEIYTASKDGLVYEANSNFGSVINNYPNTNLMGVSILNTLSSNAPGSTSALRAEVTISQAISTSLSTLLFVMQYPFTFSVGSIPTVGQSSLYSTNPIALYSSPAIYSYQVVSPNVFILVFNEQFVAGRKFIVQISQISNPYIIAATNISIYSLNFNTLTPLEAFEMLYPIATVSYTPALTLGLPYGAPFLGAMNFYQGLYQYVQVTITIPYSVPNGYSIRFQLVSANVMSGSAYANFQSLAYTTTYTYGTSYFIMSSMGPITIGTIITVRFSIQINTNTLFPVNVYIDTDAVINAFPTTTGSNYLYYNLVEGSGITSSSFFNDFYDSPIGWGERVMNSPTISNSQWFYIQIYQSINAIATSAGSYIDLYFSPNVIISSAFNQNVDCELYQQTFNPSYQANSCLVTIVQTSTYVKVTVQTNSAYSASVPNYFPYQSSSYIRLKNMAFTLSSTNLNVFPVYCALYQSNVVNPTTYYYVKTISSLPSYNGLTGTSLQYQSNVYGSTYSQAFPGVLRYQSTTPASFNSIVVQPNQQLVISFFSTYGFRSISSLGNMQPYPCTSNVPVSCTYYIGYVGSNRISMYDRVTVTFLDQTYKTTPFQILISDMQLNQNNNYVYAYVGFYNMLTKDWQYYYGSYYYRSWPYWNPAINTTLSTMGADISGKAGSYRNNVSVTVSIYYNYDLVLGGRSFIFLSTQWSFFENGKSSLTPASLAMTTPVTFGSNNIGPLGFYMASGMYLTVIPFTYIAAVSPFTFYFNNVHMPYSYDLPSYYIYVTRSSDQQAVTFNQYVMTNGGTLYQSPLQSLTVSCRDNAIGTISTYCTINFGTSNPLLMGGAIRVSMKGLTVSTSICYLTASNGTSIPTTCTSSTDNLNVTVVMQGGIGFYLTGNYSLVIYGVGIPSNSLSQSMTLYLYDSSITFAIETGVRILMTTIAGLSYISLNQIVYSYLNPLSYNTMTIDFSLPRMLYEDEQFAFVIGQDLSDVNTEPARLNIIIKRSDGVILYPLFYIDNVNYLIVFSFADPTQLTATSYVMTIYGICTPASQSNGAFNMIYRRTYDYTYTVVNSVNVIFPTLNTLTTSNISITSYFNAEGYKQQIDFSIVNTQLDVDQSMVWIINFPSYYSPELFQQDAYCLIDSAVIPCSLDPNTPYQLIISNSPKTKAAGVAYTISVVGLACPRGSYTNSILLSRYIFVGVLETSTSSLYAERALLLPYQSVQSTVGGIINVQNMVGVSTSSLFAFSSIYAQFQLYSSVAISSGSYLLVDLPIQFDNLNNIALNAILIYGSSVISSSAPVVNRRIQISVSINIPLKTSFIVQFPNLPTPKLACSAPMSEMIVMATPSNKLSVYSASNVQGNSAPVLNFVHNSLYISFNNDQNVVITAGTYSSPILITASNGGTFLSNININLTSSGFTFTPSSIFLPIGATSRSFIVGADGDLVPVVYFYQATKQEEVNTNYQMTLNMNIQVTNTPVTITLPASLNMPLGGCTDPFLINLANPPFQDMTITYVFDNTLYSQDDFYSNPLTSISQMAFTPTVTNGTFSFCSSPTLTATQIPLSFYLSGTNYKSYKFAPSNVILINIVNTAAGAAPTISLVLKNQQKTFLDVNFTNNVDGTIFYQMMLGQNKSPLTLQAIQVDIKASTWVLAAPSDFLSHVYTTDVDNRLGTFFQAASTSTLRLSNLVPESFYTLCAYIVNKFGISSGATCLQLSTMTWGTVMKATIKFTSALNAQKLNNILCWFTLAVGTSQLYLVDQQSNSCGNRAVGNVYFTYSGNSFTTETLGTNIYLVTNPYLTGIDPSPLAFTNLFNALGQLSVAALASAQSMFSITYLSATYVNSYNARLMTAPTQASSLIPYFTAPAYNPLTLVLTLGGVQIVGNVGTVYFALVLYKQIVKYSNGSTVVNIRMNQAPSAEQVLNCQNWQGGAAEGCGRAVYTGIAPLTVTFNGIQANSLYMLYYLAASEFPLRPIVSGQVQSQTIVTYAFEGMGLLNLGILLMGWLLLGDLPLLS